MFKSFGLSFKSVGHRIIVILLLNEMSWTFVQELWAFVQELWAQNYSDFAIVQNFVNFCSRALGFCSRALGDNIEHYVKNHRNEFVSFLCFHIYIYIYIYIYVYIMSMQHTTNATLWAVFSLYIHPCRDKKTSPS